MGRHALDGRRIGESMARAGLGGDAIPHVAELDLDTLDLEAHQRAVGEGEDYDAGRRIGLLERHRQQIEGGVRVRVLEAEMRNLQDAIEF